MKENKKWLYRNGHTKYKHENLFVIWFEAIYVHINKYIPDCDSKYLTCHTITIEYSNASSIQAWLLEKYFRVYTSTTKVLDDPQNIRVIKELYSLF